MTWFWFLISAIAVVAGVIALTRTATTRREYPPDLDDDDIDRIVREGRLSVDDEPLDFEHIDDEERRFWAEEQWDESEDWSR